MKTQNVSHSNLRAAQAMVRHFMVTTGQAAPDKPCIPELAVRKLRHELTSEEILEWLEAEAIGDIVGVADAFADRLYVLLGDCVAYGIEIEDLFDEVHRSNMTKTIDGSFREDGKYLKGPSYEKPNLSPIIFDQMTTEDEKIHQQECEERVWNENESKQ